MKDTNGLLNSYSASDGCDGQDVESKACTGGLCRKLGKFFCLPTLRLKKFNDSFRHRLVGKFQFSWYKFSTINEFYRRVSFPANLTMQNSGCYKALQDFILGVYPQG